MSTLMQARWSDFRGGLDTREGTYVDGSGPMLFTDLVNAFCAQNRRLRRRWPVKQLDAQLSDHYQGCFLVDGQVTVVKYAGDVGTITGADAALVNTLSFDLPPNMDPSNWELLDIVVVDSVPCAAIRHQYSGGTINGVLLHSFVYLHVWDGYHIDGEPTWVADPDVPSNWLHGWGYGSTDGAVSGTLGKNEYVGSYTPRLTVVGTRLAMSRPDGRVALSKLGNPRSWNLRTQSDIEEGGESICFMMPPGIDKTVTLPIAHDSLVWDGSVRREHRYYSYVLELPDGEGGWYTPQATALTYPGIIKERTAATALTSQNQWKIADSSGNTLLTLRDNSGDWDNKILRFRAIRRNHFTGTLGPYDEQAKDYVLGTWDAYWAEKLDTPNAVFRWANEMEWPDPDQEKYDHHLAFRIPHDSAQYTFALFLSKNDSIESGAKDIELGSTSPLGPTATNYTGLLGPPNATNHYVPSAGNVFALSFTADPVEWMLGQQRYFAWLFPYTFSSDGTDFTVAKTPWLDPDPDWHQKQFDREIDMAGAGSSAVIGNASYDSGAGPVLTLNAVRNNVLVQYEGSTQVWNVPADADSISHVDTNPFGCGASGYPEAIQFDAGLVLTPTVSGWRAWDVVGNVTVSSLQDKNIGGAIDLERIGQFWANGAGYWPHQGCYATLGTLDGNSAGFLFRFSREMQIASWSQVDFSADQTPRWRNPGSSPPAGTTWYVERSPLCAHGDRLYWRTDDTIRYFDAGEKYFLYDYNESQGSGYQVTLKTHNIRMTADYLKRLQHFDVDQSGTITVQVNIASDDPSELLQGPTINGMTYDNRRVHLPYLCYSFSLTITSTSDILQELREIAVAWTPLKRLQGS